MALQAKSMYVFRLDATQEQIEELLQNWLEENHFERLEDAQGVFYQARKRFFEYSIEGNQLTLYVYVKSRKNPVGLENGIIGMMDVMSYLNILTPLFTELGLKSMD
jgi:hypothetical protein